MITVFFSSPYTATVRASRVVIVVSVPPESPVVLEMHLVAELQIFE